MIKNNRSRLDAAFRIYGDNILECEHLIEWLKVTKLSELDLIEKGGVPDRPVYIFHDKLMDLTYAFQLCPYYGGTGPSGVWPNDPLKGIFDEKPDVLITKVLENENESSPILTLEFCDALQAGNQVWQRFRRSVNAAQHGIPYLYVLPLIGWERDSEGFLLRNPRYQSAQVCIAQLTMCSMFGVPSLQIYSKTSWSPYAKTTGHTLPENFESFIGSDAGKQLACLLLRTSVRDDAMFSEKKANLLKTIIKEMILVARTYSKFSNTYLPVHYNHAAFQPSNLDKVSTEYATSLACGKEVTGEFALHNINESDFEKFGVLFYKHVEEKTCSREFRTSILAFLNWKNSESIEYKTRYLLTWGVPVKPGLGSSELNKVAILHRGLLPLTYKENKSEAALIRNRNVLRFILERAYPKLGPDVLDWVYVNSKRDLPAI